MMAKFCPNCGGEVGEATFCPGCGKELGNRAGQENQQKKKYVRKGGRGPGNQPKRHGRLIPVLGITALVVICFIIFSNSFEKTPPRNITIMDTSRLAGASLEELQTIYKHLEEDGPIDLLTRDGATVEGIMYSITGSMTNFVLVDDKVVTLQFWPENPISYQKESDIFGMFGVELGDTAKIEADTGYALRVTNVSEQISEFWVQSMNTKERTFDAVRIVFDSYYQ